MNYPYFPFIYEKNKKKDNEPLPLYKELDIPYPIRKNESEEEIKEIIIQLFFN